MSAMLVTPTNNQLSPLIITPISSSRPNKIAEKSNQEGPSKEPKIDGDWNIHQIGRNLRDKIKENHTDIHRACVAFDTRRDGFVNITDLQRILSNFCFPLTVGLYQTLLTSWGFKASHKISYQEFLKKFLPDIEDSYALPYKDTHYFNPIRGDDNELAPNDVFQLVKKIVSQNQASLKSTFLKLDDNKDGSLNWTEFRLALDALPIRISDRQFSALMKTIDPNKRKKISYHDFLDIFEEREFQEGHPWLHSSHIPKKSLPPVAMSQAMVEKLMREKIQDNWGNFTKAFVSIDSNKDGYISKSELAQLLKKYALVITPKHFERVWQKCDENSDEKIQFSEFMKSMGINIHANDLDGFSKRIHEESDSKIKTKEMDQERRFQEEKYHQARLISGQSLDEILNTLKDIVQQRSGDFRQTFSKLDLDGDGKISKKELRSLLFQLQIHLSKENFTSLLTKFNFVNGKLSYPDFLNLFQETRKCQTQDLIRKPNHRYHPVIESTNIIPADEALTLLRKKIEQNDASLRRVFQNADTNNNGHISGSEFRRLVNKFMMPLNNEQFVLLMQLLNVGTGQKVNYKLFLERFERKEDLRTGHPWLFNENEFKDSRAPQEVDADRAFRLLSEKASEQWIDLSTAFRSFDRDQNSSVSKAELKRILHRFNIPVNKEQFVLLWRKFDTDRNGRIDHGEFLHKLGSELAPSDAKGLSTKIMSQNTLEIKNHEQRQKSKKEKAMKICRQNARFMNAEEVENRLRDKFRDGFENFRKAFLKYDLNKDGYVSKDEFQTILSEFHYLIANEEVEKLLTRIGLKNSERISYVEFLDIFENGKAKFVKKGISDSKDKIKNRHHMSDTEIVEFVQKAVVDNFSAVSRACKSFDVLQNGKIRTEQIQSVINSFCLQITKTQFKLLVDANEIVLNDVIDYNEFLAALLQSSSHTSRNRKFHFKNQNGDNTMKSTPQPRTKVWTQSVALPHNKRQQIPHAKGDENDLLRSSAGHQNHHDKTKEGQKLSKLVDDSLLLHPGKIKQKKRDILVPLPSHKHKPERNLEVQDVPSQVAIALGKISTLIIQNTKPIRRTFRIIDKTGSGNVNVEEFRDVLHRFKITLSTEDSYRILSYFDEHLSGKVPYNTFLEHFGRV